MRKVNSMMIHIFNLPRCLLFWLFSYIVLKSWDSLGVMMSRCKFRNNLLRAHCGRIEFKSRKN